MRNIIIFLSGLTIGSAVSAFVAKSYYKKLYLKDMESVKDSFRKHHNGKVNIDRNYIDASLENRKADCKNEMDNKYSALATTYATSEIKSDIPKKKNHSDVEIISREVHDNLKEFKNYVLTYYMDDKILADDDDCIHDGKYLFGKDILSALNDSDTDSVYIVNYKTKCVFEICISNGSYEEITGLSIGGDEED